MAIRDAPGASILPVCQLTSADSSWPVSIDPGPLDMLRSGRWDATSQLLEHGRQVAELMQTLPYINQFAA